MILEADHLEERIAAQTAREGKFLKGRKGELKAWEFSVGKYTREEDDIVPGHHPYKEIIDNEGNTVVTLEGYEVFAHDLLVNLLEVKNDGLPAIALDLGGGAGISWHRLALAFREEVRESKLAFVVSNLVDTPKEQLQNHNWRKKVYGSGPNFDTDMLTADLHAAKGLVHPITGPFFSLRMSSIELPNGNTIRLDGNVDFMNEKLSLSAHSLTPDLDIPATSQLLSPFGIYVAHTSGVTDQDTHVADFFLPQRRHGIQLAHDTLQSHCSLRKISTIEGGSQKGNPFAHHNIFKAQKAPLLIA